jgi:hypothetical protein
MPLLTNSVEGITMRSPFARHLALAVAVFPAPLLAQGLTIQSITDVRFHGRPRNADEHRLEVGGGSPARHADDDPICRGIKSFESGNTATIIDVDAGRMIAIDNKAKTTAR